MLVLQKRELADQKLNRLKNGYSAYAETEELSRMIKRRITSQKLDIHIDNTENGYWFIPVK
ncbi:hypothetical protein CEY16_05930 [Halalkalibacillus sediminis]|uniref:Uncharacterized protein n=1 Tax=Halalkalibacillus sediminis TaxID=2018042 RepID=A0A2I0QY85_9BACI|nr:hypothetical protein [Halalkalibacillus sediminis]PKR79278.1 hypothetical protein CEY16_05930 [Halalkalibacillus sediminis]